MCESALLSRLQKIPVQFCFDGLEGEISRVTKERKKTERSLKRIKID